MKLILSYDNPQGGYPELVEDIAQAVKKNLFFELAGGLGDIINTISEYGLISKLDALQPDDRVVIALWCHNPCSPDLFYYHPKSSQITVLLVGTHDPADRAYRRRHGLPVERVFHSHVVPHETFRPDISESDRSVIDYLPKRFAVFSVTASRGSIDYRTVPERIVESAVNVCIRKGIAPVFVGRRYPNTIAHDHEREHDHNEINPPCIAGVVSVIDRLSVHGSLECVRRSLLNVVCNSSMMCGSWRMKRPTFLICSDDELKFYDSIPQEHRPGCGYYGLLRPENSVCSHSGYFDGQLSAFIERTLA